MQAIKRRKQWVIKGIVALCIVAVVPWVYGKLTHHTPVPAPTSQTATVPKSQQVTCTGSMLFMGDTMLARSIGTKIQAGKDPYVHVKDILAKSDLRIANVETVIAAPSSGAPAAGKLYTFNAPLQAIDTLQRAYIDVAVLANNHTSDYGPGATADMLQRFTTANITTVGAGTTPSQAFAPLIKQLPLSCGTAKASIKVAFVAVNDIETNFTTVAEGRAGGAYFSKEKIAASIALARQQGATYTIVIPHWGVEYQASPSQRQKEWAETFMTLGADAVIGGHPHVIQPSETIQGKPVVYSLGNFIFDQMDGADRGTMAKLTVTLPATAQNNSVQIGTPPVLTQPELIPYALDADGFPQQH